MLLINASTIGMCRVMSFVQMECESFIICLDHQLGFVKSKMKIMFEKHQIGFHMCMC